MVEAAFSRPAQSRGVDELFCHLEGTLTNETASRVLDELSRTATHSCNPTCGMRGVSKLFALRNIRKGEEITYDYSATTGPNVSSSIWTMDCICGARNCRKIIGNVLSIPEKQLNKYKKSGALQNYIVQELRRIRTTISGEFVLPKYKKIPVGGPPKRR